jgi:hypothetical protein
VERRHKHGGIEVRFHEAHAIAPQLVIAIAAGLDKKKPDHQQRIENDDPVVDVWLAERDG